jgi:hypothetical protein
LIVYASLSPAGMRSIFIWSLLPLGVYIAFNALCAGADAL